MNKPCVPIECPDIEEIVLNEVREFTWIQTERGPIALFFEERTPLTKYTPPWERA